MGKFIKFKENGKILEGYIIGPIQYSEYYFVESGLFTDNHKYHLVKAENVVAGIDTSGFSKAVKDLAETLKKRNIMEKKSITTTELKVGDIVILLLYNNNKQKAKITYMDENNTFASFIFEPNRPTPSVEIEKSRIIAKLNPLPPQYEEIPVVKEPEIVVQDFDACWLLDGTHINIKAKIYNGYPQKNKKYKLVEIE